MVPLAEIWSATWPWKQLGTTGSTLTKSLQASHWKTTIHSQFIVNSYSSDLIYFCIATFGRHWAKYGWPYLPYLEGQVEVSSPSCVETDHPVPTHRSQWRALGPARADRCERHCCCRCDPTSGASRWAWPSWDAVGCSGMQWASLVNAQSQQEMIEMI